MKERPVRPSHRVSRVLRDIGELSETETKALREALLRTWAEDEPGPDGIDEGGVGGVREPRRPRPSPRSGDAAVEAPRRGNDDALSLREAEPGTPEYAYLHRFDSPDNERDSMG